VHALDAIALPLHERLFGRATLAPGPRCPIMLTGATAATGATTFSPQFLAAEWDEVVDAWQLDT
jgi:hypothetical protein